MSAKTPTTISVQDLRADDVLIVDGTPQYVLGLGVRPSDGAVRVDYGQPVVNGPITTVVLAATDTVQVA